MKLLIFNALVLFIFAFSTMAQDSVKIEPTNLPDEDLINETIFRKILESRHSDFDKVFKTIYLSINDGKNPNEDLLKKFQDFSIPVKKASDAYKYMTDGVLEEETDREGIVFWISKLKWKNKDEVEATAGSSRGNIGSDDCKYTLKRANGKWKIVSVDNCFIS